MPVLPLVRFDDGGARFQFALTLRGLDHVQTDAVFDRTARVERFELSPDFRVILVGERAEFNDGGGAD
jgi:hypothetical protein